MRTMTRKAAAAILSHALNAAGPAGWNDTVVLAAQNRISSAIAQGKRKDKNSQPPSNHSRRSSKYRPHQGAQECARRLMPNYYQRRNELLIPW